MTIIPDTIDPYVGYKALYIDANGHLVSPSYRFVWTPGNRVEATCGQMSWNWQLKPGPDPEPEWWMWGASAGSTNIHQRWYRGPQRPPPQYYAVYSTGTPNYVVGAPTQWDVIEKPTEAPPEGYHWAWDCGPHPAGDQWCSCGIYAVDTPEQTFPYLKVDCVLVKVAMWGKVTRGEKGARGQYAYPQVMYLPNHMKERGITVAATYDIPWEKPPGNVARRQLVANASVNPQLQALKEREEAASAALFFGVLAVLFSAIGMSFRLFFPNAPTQITMTVLSLVCAGITLLAALDARK